MCTQKKSQNHAENSYIFISKATCHLYKYLFCTSNCYIQKQLNIQLIMYTTILRTKRVNLSDNPLSLFSLIVEIMSRSY